MPKVKNAFFCSTPYQIITSIVLNYLFGEESDIYIVPQFKTAAKCAENLNDLDIFRRVKLVDTSMIEEHKKAKSKLLMHVGIVRQYFNVDVIARSFLFTDTEYEKIYVSSKAYIPRMAYLYFVKNGFKTELVYYDDGEGSYYNRYRIESSSADKLIRRFVFGKRIQETNQNNQLFLYEPNLYRSLNGNHWKGEIIPIPHVVCEEPIRSLVSKVFDITKSDVISERAIILDILKTGKFSRQDIKRLFEIYGNIQKVFGDEDTIIKKHPRDKSDELTSFKCYERYNIPFECLCSQMNMNEKVLIAVSSTAVVIPKILNGQEPVVILLYKLIEQTNRNNEYRKKQDSFYQLCKNNYGEKNRFFIPESFEELAQILKSFS